MSEPDQATIPIRSTSSDMVDVKKIKSTSGKSTKRLIIRLFNMTFYAVFLLSAGWGIWHFLGSTSKVNNADVIAELDGFQLAPAFSLDSKPVDSPAPDPTNINPPLATAPLPPMTAMNVSNENASANDAVNPVEVWFTGTIEEADSIPKSESPLRISGGPSDSTTVR